MERQKKLAYALAPANGMNIIKIYYEEWAEFSKNQKTI